jgi:hypothetical protein
MDRAFRELRFYFFEHCVKAIAPAAEGIKKIV